MVLKYVNEFKYFSARLVSGSFQIIVEAKRKSR